MTTLPAIADFNTLPPPDFNSIISLLFEPAPPLAKALYAARPFDSYDRLLQQTDAILHKLSPEDKLIVINAHPRIGEKKTNLSAMSLKEQGYTSATAQQPNEEDPQVMARLKELNNKYEAKYGFKFVVFVNGRSKEEIVPVMEQRLKDGTKEREMETGLRDMVSIARDRLGKHQR
ncbi:Oxo-4-hydroxy-4-carboxy-5-ureidoimidazoline decarboxylase [Fimicolochytrium jonesii]|uniref:Oxo-4-hydroxy-4-carboxy-5-ureidoimidazoline decarboxylase n=1 Tax=Fimicolochytrium jonesii TaxID=1396493 RepID=UPI0022FE47D8|nr:Oxo-4-hydroxy-4-carboxy-5-ureidoimidazoline decarboxylase [Fimicolochytrium jonesii]KAI8816095.1 Oxo-4-hydroxy-4-carboxy-5-ureidoimidazoline decarboxylase [Fimicolochytrium jonesii]